MTNPSDNQAMSASPISAGTAGKKPGRKKGVAQVVEVHPIAPKATMQKRHWGLVVSFLILVALPLLVSAWYLVARAQDQYASTVGFTVRQEGGGGAADFVGLASQLTGGSAQSDTDVLFEFLQSQGVVEKIDSDFDIIKHYSQNVAVDPLFSLDPEATLEEKVDFWSRIALVSYDKSSRLIEIEIRAFDPDTAHGIATKVLEHSQDLINQMNATAREDKIKYAQEDLDLAVERLKKSREELIRFRTANKIVDLGADLESRLGVVNTLQQQLAGALVELDLLALNTSENDPRFVQTKNEIEVIRKRLEVERANAISGSGNDLTSDYPTLLAEYEGLVVDREYAEQSYRAALASLDIARTEATRQSSYLAPYLAPTFPQSAEYPRRWMLFGLATLFVTLSWTILALIYYSIRDSR